MSTRTSERRVGSVAVSGAVAGVVAWVLGYAVTYLAAGQQVTDSLADFNSVIGLIGGNEVPTWKAVGWLYLNAHTVVVRATGIPGGPRTYDFIAESDASSATFLYVVPPLVLLVVVGVAVALSGARDVVSGAIGGGGAVVGYFVATAVMVVFTTHTFAGNVTVTSALVPALLLAGVVYPVVCGSVVGALVGLVRS